MAKQVVINRTQDENDDVYVFEANTWFFGEGGINLTMQQLNQIQQAYQ